MACPECGAAGASAARLTPRLRWWVRWLPGWFVLALSIVIATACVAGIERFPMTVPATIQWRSPNIRVTAEVLRRAADEGEGLGELREALAGPFHWWSREGVPVRIGYVQEVAGYRNQTGQFGWPVVLFNWHHDAAFNDVFARTGPVPIDWGVSRASWMGDMWNYTTSGASVPTLSRLWRAISLPGVATMALLAWFAAIGGAAGARRLKKRPRDGAVIGAALITAIFTLASWTSIIVVDEVNLQRSLPQNLAMAHSPVAPGPSTVAELEVTETQWLGMLRSDEGCRALAARVLAAGESPGHLVLARSMVARSANSYYTRWPSWWFTYEAGTTQESSLAFRNDRGQISIEHAWGGRYQAFILSLPMLGMFGLGAMICRQIGVFVRAGVVRGIARRRMRRGRCVVCDYDLRGLCEPPVAGGERVGR